MTTLGIHPVDLYEQLLKYVIALYGKTYWFALPREVAAFAVQVKPRLAGA